jgi:hypothetical protein
MKKVLQLFNKIKLKAWLTSHKTSINYALKLIITILVYGFLINYMMHFIFSVPFKIITIPAWGILAYIIKAELPELIRDSFPNKPKV